MGSLWEGPKSYTDSCPSLISSRTVGTAKQHRPVLPFGCRNTTLWSLVIAVWACINPIMHFLNDYAWQRLGMWQSTCTNFPSVQCSCPPFVGVLMLSEIECHFRIYEVINCRSCISKYVLKTSQVSFAFFLNIRVLTTCFFKTNIGKAIISF